MDHAMNNWCDEGIAIMKHFADKFDLEVMNLYIAGGWAACPFRANDIDIWLLNPDVEIIDSSYRRLGNLIHGQSLYEQNEAECFGSCDVKPLDWFGTNVQIIETPHGIGDLLALFDLSCHCYGITSDGLFVVGSEATHPFNEPVKILTPDHTTDHRLQKVMERYGIQVEEVPKELDIPF